MEKKKSPGAWLGTFFSEKGFYIVLLLSAAVIATSIWLLFAGRETYVEEPVGETQMTVSVWPTVKEAPTVVIEPAEPPVQQGLERPEEAEEGRLDVVWTPEEEREELPLYFIWPVGGILERGHSMEALAYDVTMADWRTHDGWDIGASLGAQVLAAANGTVSAVRQDDLYGTVVEIDHGGTLVSCYANLADTPTVSVGDRVRVGDVIGSVGTTALCEVGQPSHLHFSMRYAERSADPGNWLPER